MMGSEELAVNGLLYNGTDASAFVNAIVNIANNNEALETMQRKSRENYLRQFAVEKEVQLLLDYYMSVLHGSSANFESTCRHHPRGLSGDSKMRKRITGV